MATFAGGKIEAFVGPTEVGGADDLEAAIVGFIAGAKKTLDIAVQELDNEAIAQAILDRAMSGVSVRMFMEQDYLAADKPPKIKAKAGETAAEAAERTVWQERRRSADQRTNRDILAALLRCGVDVKADLNPKIFHQKFIVRDYRNGKSQGGEAGLLTGSTNFTWTGTHKNLNHVVVFHDYRVARAYSAEFDEILDGTFGEANERHKDTPRVVNLNGVPVRILFAPDHAPELEVIKQMLKCEERVDFAIFTFSGSSGIDDALIMLHAAEREIHGAIDRGQGKMWWAATHWLHDAGIDVFMPERSQLPGLGKLHHKLMVIDDIITIAGSMNYTKPANDYNDENVFVIGSPHLDLPKSKGGPVDIDACREIGLYFREEIDRIIAHSEIFEPS